MKDAVILTKSSGFLNHYLDMFKGTLFRQTMFAEFEKITHEKTAAGETLNAQSLCQIYGDLNALYFGLIW